jgi:hypothetical protein
MSFYRFSLALGLIAIASSGLLPAATPDNELAGKVVAGYQGWFAPAGDGSGLEWVHYGGRRFGPGHCTFDLWPDLSEFGADEKFATPFRFPNGEVAPVFSASNATTVNRHFQWMRDYGIDGAALQRFGANLDSPEGIAWRDKVLENCRHAAAANGRIWFIMYDLSGLNDENIIRLVTGDWKRLIDKDDFRKDAGYTRQHGRPLVAIWGIGFSDHRKYSLESCRKLVEFFKNDPKYGGNAVMEGVPYHWREGNADSEPADVSHPVYEMADVISPWAVGRYRTIPAAQEIGKMVGADKAWCDEHKIAYLPVIFPGFSWQNLQKSHRKDSPLDEIPREKGNFLWSQAVSAIKAGAGSLYVAMFDEIDEGTAIFKVTSTPPVGESKFSVFDAGLPSDHYLWLVGQIGKALHQPPTSLTYRIPERAAAK